MSLRVKCQCGRRLQLDDAFAGGHCRCQYCRGMVAVPLADKRRDSAGFTRPLEPTVHHRSHSAVALKSKTSPRGPNARRIVSFARVTGASTFVVLLMFVGGVTFWNGSWPFSSDGIAVTVLPPLARPALPGSVTGPEDSEITVASSASPQDQDVDAAAELVEARDSMIPGDEYSRSFAGINLSGETVAFVVDSDQTMAPYLDRVADLADHLVSATPAESRKFAYVRAISDTSPLTTFDRIVPLSGAPTRQQSGYLRTISGGQTELVPALKVAHGYKYDEVVMIFSKPLTIEMLHELKGAINVMRPQTTTHVVALGEAALMDLSPIANTTRGTVLRIDEAELGRLHRHIQDAADRTELASSSN